MISVSRYFCLMTKAHEHEQLVQSRIRQRGGWESNPPPPDCESDDPSHWNYPHIEMKLKRNKFKTVVKLFRFNVRTVRRTAMNIFYTRADVPLLYWAFNHAAITDVYTYYEQRLSKKCGNLLKILMPPQTVYFDWPIIPPTTVSSVYMFMTLHCCIPPTWWSL